MTDSRPWLDGRVVTVYCDNGHADDPVGWRFRRVIGRWSARRVGRTDLPADPAWAGDPARYKITCWRCGTNVPARAEGLREVLDRVAALDPPVSLRLRDLPDYLAAISRRC